MWTSPLLARLPHGPDEVRCECKTCGAHTYSPPSSVHIRHCGNCHSVSLAPIELGRGNFAGPAAA